MEPNKVESTIKKLAPYVGIPAIGCMWFFLRGVGLEGYTVIIRELLIVFGYLAALTDIRERRVPNKLIVSMVTAWVLTTVPPLIINTDEMSAHILSSLVGLAVASLAMLITYIVSRHGLGGGDVKWMSATGLYLGFRAVLPALLCGSVLSALYGGIMVLLKKMSIKDTLPFIPFLYAGVLLTIFVT